jgi:exodeoxyribonuclease VII large subunit
MQPERTTYTLLELTRSIQKTVADRYVSAYWIRAEMNKLNHYSHSGHCFPELVEKQHGKVVAQMRSTLWHDDYIRANEQFIETLGQPLKDGIKILLLARVAFDPIYGLSLRIMDIDPAYTLGDIEREKQETILKLRKEGIYDQNKSLVLPLLPKRLAIISVETSKGLADFMEITEKNPWGYKFFHMLFPSLLQGDKAVETIIMQLSRIKKVRNHFDAVAIIRGGGDDIGLSCFNNYRLANAIANFPIPVLSGIGHSTNETVTELIAHYNAITPTKLAEYLIQAFHNFSVPVMEAQEALLSIPSEILKKEKERLITISNMIGRTVTSSFIREKQTLQNQSFRMKREVFHIVSRSRYEVNQYSAKLGVTSKTTLTSNYQILVQTNKAISYHSRWQLANTSKQLMNVERQVRHLDPVHVLKRGYSITMLHGKAIRDHSMVKMGDTLQTKLFNGNIQSIVQSSSNDSTDG